MTIFNYKIMKYLYSTLLIIILIPGYSAFSEEPAKVVSLNACITIAIQNNPALMVSEEDKKRALAEYRAANAQRNIFINAEIRSTQYPKVPKTWKYASYDSFVPYLSSPSDPVKFLYTAASKKKQAQKSDNAIDQLSEYYTLGISFGLTAGVSLYNEKKNRLVQHARSGMKLADLQTRKAMGDVIFSVKKAYYSYKLSQETVVLQKKLVKYNEDRLKLIEVFYKNAQKQLYELSKARYDYSDSQLQLQKSINAERASRIELLRAMGMTDQGTEFVLEKNDDIPELQYSLDELVKLGELNYPDMQIVRMQKEMTKIKVAVEKAGHYPEVDLQIQAGYENGQLDRYIFDSSNWKPSFAAGFVAKIPLYSGGLVSAKVDAAETEYNKMVYKEKDASVNMQLSLQNNYATLQELAKQLPMLKLMIENAEKHYRLSLKLYESGSTTMLELHDANISRVNSEMSYLHARYDYLMTIAKISSIVVLGEDSLCKK
jgi:outer membrane protein TolC